MYEQEQEHSSLLTRVDGAQRRMPIAVSLKNLLGLISKLETPIISKSENCLRPVGNGCGKDRASQKHLCLGKFLPTGRGLQNKPNFGSEISAL